MLKHLHSINLHNVLHQHLCDILLFCLLYCLLHPLFLIVTWSQVNNMVTLKHLLQWESLLKTECKQIPMPTTVLFYYLNNVWVIRQEISFWVVWVSSSSSYIKNAVTEMAEQPERPEIRTTVSSPAPERHPRPDQGHGWPANLLWSPCPGQPGPPVETPAPIQGPIRAGQPAPTYSLGLYPI